MWRNAHDTYLEERILSAGPIELVHLLYQGGIAAVNDARRHLAEGRILPRARAISKACDILVELNTSLDFARGGEISVRLAQLYGYMHRRLVEANRRQSDDALAEVAGLLTTLQEGWSGVTEAAPAESRSQTDWTPAAYGESALPEMSGAWSF